MTSSTVDGGRVVIVHSLYFDNPSLNLANILIVFLILFTIRQQLKKTDTGSVV